MLDSAAAYESNIIPAPEIGRRIVNTPFGQITVEWPEDPRVRVTTSDNYSDAAESYYNPTPPGLQAFLNMPDYLKDPAIAQRMKDQADARSAFVEPISPTPTPNPTGGGAGGGGGGTNPPPPNNPSTLPLPDASKEPLSMPNIDTVIADEIKRITLSLAEDVKEFTISSGVDYKSIDFYPQPDVVRSKKTTIAHDLSDELVNYIENKIIGLSKNQRSNYNYAKYLDYFSVEYSTDTGEPIVTFNLQNLTESGFGIDSLKIVNIKKETK